MSYWQDRLSATMDKITRKTTKQIEKQLAKYYRDTAKATIEEFRAVLDRVMVGQAEGISPTPADLYRLEKYWQMQGQLSAELQKLGDKQIKTLQKAFENNYFEVYYSIYLGENPTFNTVDTEAVQHVLNSIWCADGKTWSQRIWDNTKRLKETLNEGLVHCITAGLNSNDLKHILQDRFNVSFGRADALVRTELAHIQTQAAEQRYKDYGVKRVQVWADEDERRCEVCGKLHETYHYIGEALPIPAHTNCRCCIVPVIED